MLDIYNILEDLELTFSSCKLNLANGNRLELCSWIKNGRKYTLHNKYYTCYTIDIAFAVASSKITPNTE